MLSLSCKAAIKAVIHLAIHSDSGKRLGIAEIAQGVNENEHTVGKLLQRLAKSGIINSSKGPGGGFYISPAQCLAPAMAVVAEIDGMEVFAQCGLGLEQCNDHHPCPVHEEYKDIRHAYMRMLEGRSIADLQSVVHASQAFLL